MKNSTRFLWIMLVTICFDFEKRKRSYELIAEAFGR